MSSYDNTLRASLSAQTRSRIQEAATVVIGRGLAEFTMATVAQEAGVSLRTVYAHFPRRAALLEAVSNPQSAAGAPLLTGTPAATLRELLFKLQNAASTRAESLAPGGDEAADRALEPLLTALTPTLRAMAPRERRHLAAAVALIASPNAVATARITLGLDPGECGQLIAWAVATLVRGAEMDGT